MGNGMHLDRKLARSVAAWATSPAEELNTPEQLEHSEELSE